MEHDTKFKPHFVVMALGSHSIVACSSSSSLSKTEAATSLMELQYSGANEDDLHKLPYLSQMIDEGVYMNSFVTGKRHPLSYTSRPPVANVRTGLMLPVPTEDIELSTGIAALLAPTAWGKTRLIESLAKDAADLPWATSVTHVRFCEPNSRSEFESGIDDKMIAHISVDDANSLLRNMCWHALADSHPVVMYDSLRYFIYSAGAGGTGERGMDMLLPSQLTALSNVLCCFDVLAVVAINPMVTLGMDTEDDRYERLVDMYAGSLDAVVAGKTSYHIATVFGRSSKTLRNGIDVKFLIDELDQDQSHISSHFQEHFEMDDDNSMLKPKRDLPVFASLISMSRLSQK